MIKEAFWIARYLKGKFSLSSLFFHFSQEINGWKNFWEDYRKYNNLSQGYDRLEIADLYPCIYDKTTSTPIEPIYFYQDTWAFERIIQQKPSFHIDVGSHHTFVAFLSKVIPLTMVDIRPLDLALSTLNFKEGSILDLPFDSESIESLSSLCVIEHIGLGRYGDPLDPKGSEKAIVELKRVLKPGGDLYISLPLDDENKIYFNAHRAFSEKYLLKLFDPLKVINKRYIYDKNFVEQPEKGFGIGLYHLRKTEVSS